VTAQPGPPDSTLPVPLPFLPAGDLKVGMVVRRSFRNIRELSAGMPAPTQRVAEIGSPAAVPFVVEPHSGEWVRTAGWVRVRFDHDTEFSVFHPAWEFVLVYQGPSS